jgi:uncharacterized protein
MRLLTYSLLLLSCTFAAQAQTYKDRIATFRKKYTQELLEEKRAPVKASDIDKLSFFPADRSYCVWATVEETPGSTHFQIPTHSGKLKPYRQYCKLTFMLKGVEFTLHAYQGVDLVKDPAYVDYLFIPFRDHTNYETTYGGGRYIDLSVKDIIGGRILLDFNKSYNPYCAYADGFNCPIPPDENTLQLEIPVGEKSFIH